MRNACGARERTRRRKQTNTRGQFRDDDKIVTKLFTCIGLLSLACSLVGAASKQTRLIASEHASKSKHVLGCFCSLVRSWTPQANKQKQTNARGQFRDVRHEIVLARSHEDNFVTRVTKLSSCIGLLVLAFSLGRRKLAKANQYTRTIS